MEKTHEASCSGILLAFGSAGAHFPELVREHIPKLLKFLRSENPDTVRYAVLALGNLATANPALVREARPELERLAKSTDMELSANAQMALSLL